MKKYRMVFDIDDTLNNLVETTYKRLNLLDKLHIKKKYYLKDCPELTENEVDLIEAAWSEPATYLACSAQTGIEKLNALIERDDVEGIIHSFCCNKRVANAKYKWLSRFVNLAKLIMKLEVGNKTPIADVDFVVEDNIEYLGKCKAKHKILIDRCYNQDANYALDTSEIIRVDSLDSALDYILKEITVK